MTTIPFARPSIGQAEIDAVAAVLRSGWLTTGAEALAFEREFAATVGVAHARAVNSATAGLHLALEAVGVGAGDTVIVPSLTFTASAEIARYLGADIAFADVTEDSLLIDPASVRSVADRIVADGGRVAAIVPVHLAGEACAIEEIVDFARERQIAVVEDAAHAFPGTVDGKHLGTFGDAGVYSFYANKTITTGEGGMVVTDRRDLAERVSVMRTHGIDREAWTRYTDAGTGTEGVADQRRGAHWYYEVVAPGYKYNLPDTAAAIGRVQLTRAAALREARRIRAERYRAAFAPLENAGAVILPRHAAGHAWHLYVVRVVPERAQASRDAVIQYLRERGIGTSVHYIPLHHMPYWAARYPETRGRLPNTDRRFEEIISLPLYPDLTPDDQDRVIRAFCAAVSNTAARSAAAEGTR